MNRCFMFNLIVATIVCQTMNGISWFGYDRAVHAAQHGDWQQAMQLFKEQLIDAPDKVDLLYDAGVASFKMGEIDKAYAYFKHAAEHNEADNLLTECSYFNLGNCCVEQAKLEEAISAYEKVLEISPANERAQHNLEIVKEMLKQKQQEQQNQQKKQEKDDQKQQQEKENQEKQQENKENKEQQQENQQSSADKKNNHEGEKKQESGQSQSNNQEQENEKEKEEKGGTGQEQQNQKQETSEQEKEEQSNQDSQQTQERKHEEQKQSNQCEEQEKKSEKKKRNQKQNQHGQRGEKSEQKQESIQQEQEKEKDNAQLEAAQPQYSGQQDRAEQEEMQQKGGMNKQQDKGNQKDEAVQEVPLAQAPDAEDDGYDKLDAWLASVLKENEEKDARNHKRMIKSAVSRKLAGHEGQNCW